MANQKQLEELKKQIDQLRSIDRLKLTRPSLGEEGSLETQLAPFLNEMDKQISFTEKYASGLPNDQFTDTLNRINDLSTVLSGHAGLDNPQYLQQSKQFIAELNKRIEGLKINNPYLVSQAVLERGILDDEDIKAAYNNAISKMKDEADSTLAEVKKESESVVEEAKKLAKEIEEGARKTAAGISVEDAQKQFELAENPIQNRVIFWGIASLFFVAVLIAAALYFMKINVPDGYNGWRIIYYTTIRLVILGGIASIAALSIKVFRAQMHLRELNEHRKRMANSMESFMQSALGNEQRDLILLRLVESISAFGSSGLVSKESGDEQTAFYKAPIEILSGARDKT